MVGYSTLFTCYLRQRCSAFCGFSRQVAPCSSDFSLSSLTEKLAEAQRRFTTLRTELQSTLDAQKEASGASTLPRRRKPVFHLSHEERVQHRNIKDLKLAFSELYLSLILLQNYQVPAWGGGFTKPCLQVSLCILKTPCSSQSFIYSFFILGFLNVFKGKADA